MRNQALLVRTLVDLADNLVDDFDVVDLLSLLSDRCVAALDVTAAGVLLVAPTGVLRVAASSSETMRALELFQLQSENGPCIEAYRTGNAVVNVDLAAPGSPWPNFATRAMAEGFHAAHSLPMRLRGRRLGALNLLHTAPGAFDDADIAAAQALSDIASIAIIQHRIIADAKTLNAQLSGALNSRISIEQAKGIMAQANGIGMDRAFQRLRHYARSHNMRLSELCEQVALGNRDPRSL